MKQIIRYDLMSNYWILGYYSNSEFVVVAKWPNIDSPKQNEWSKEKDNIIEFVE